MSTSAFSATTQAGAKGDGEEDEDEDECEREEDEDEDGEDVDVDVDEDVDDDINESGTEVLDADLMTSATLSMMRWQGMDHDAENIKTVTRGSTDRHAPAGWLALSRARASACAW